MKTETITKENRQEFLEQMPAWFRKLMRTQSKYAKKEKKKG